MKQLFELDVYNLSEKLSDYIWYDFDKWPAKAQNTIGYQVIRSSDSIAANIAEACLPARQGLWKIFTSGQKKILSLFQRFF